MVAIATGVVRG